MAVIVSPLIAGNMYIHVSSMCLLVLPVLSLHCNPPSHLKRMMDIGYHAGGVLGVPPSDAVEYGLDYKKELARRRRKIPESEFQDGPDGLKCVGRELKALNFGCKS